MLVRRLRLRDFRNHERLEADLGEPLTVVSGPNGAGKSNLLEALYVALTGRSPRTATDAELVRRGGGPARVEVELEADDGAHLIEVGLRPGDPKRVRVDGAAVDSLAAVEARPLVVLFMPERLELVKGAPALRRGHLDRLLAALWPGRAGIRPAYSRALAQRNALLARIRAGAAAPDALDPWDAELARRGAELMAYRREAVARLASPFASWAEALGLAGEAELAYRPRSGAADAPGLAAELRDRRAADLERGFSAHGPHRDDLRLAHGGVALRTYGSQGQQRTALLALLFAERQLLLERRGRPPLMLLDDVMSELDEHRRSLLAERLGGGGQALVTATELDHVPGAHDAGVRRIELGAGSATTAFAAA